MNWWIHLTSVLDHLHHFIICVLLTQYQHFIFKYWQENLICRSGHPGRALQCLSSPIYDLFSCSLTTRLMNSSWMDSSTNKRPAAMQFSPLLKYTELMPCETAEDTQTHRWYQDWKTSVIYRVHEGLNYMENSDTSAKVTTLHKAETGKYLSVSLYQSCCLTMRTALSMSQSLKMMRGDFPPSSRETFFRLLTAQL